MKILLRDDDTSAMMETHELETLLNLIPETAKLVVGVVPFVHQSMFKIMDFEGTRPDQYKNLAAWVNNLHYEDKLHFNTSQPLHDSTGLLLALREAVSDKRVEIALHGITHKFYELYPEFLHNDYTLNDVLGAKRYLEEHLNTDISFFIPPSNSINSHNFNIVNQCGLKVLTSGLVQERSRIKSLFIKSHIGLENFHAYIKHGFQFPKILKYKGKTFYRSVGFEPGMKAFEFYSLLCALNEFIDFCSIAFELHM